jgi:hypothetical protein
MQSPADMINEALKEAKVADYVLDITSKVVKDKKIVVSTLMHLKKSIILSMKSYLSYLKEKGRIRNVFSTDELVYEYFMQNHSAEFLQSFEDRKNFSSIFDSMKSYDYRGMILEKEGKYTFISKDYELINLKFEELKKFIKTAIDFSKSLEAKIKND